MTQNWITSLTKKSHKKNVRAGIALLLVLSIFIPGIPFQRVAAAPTVTQLHEIGLPIYLGNANTTMTIYVMQDGVSYADIFCTKKGSSLPNSNLALDQGDLNANLSLIHI